MLQSLDEFYVRNITTRFFVIIWQYSIVTALKSPLRAPLSHTWKRKKGARGRLVQLLIII